MIFDIFATKILTFLLSVVSTSTIPSNQSQWQIDQSWTSDKHHPQLLISSQVTEIGCTNEHFLQLPTLLYGAITLEHNDSVLRRYGDSTFKTPNFVFNAPSIDCADLPRSGVVKIRFTAYSPLYAVISSWPMTTKHRSLADFFYRFSYVGGAFALILVSLSLFFATLKHEDKRTALFLCGSAVLLAIYQIGAVLPVFDLRIPMVMVHRYTDRALSIGFVLFFFALRQEAYLGRRLFFVHVFAALVGLIFNVFSLTGDGIQFGTTLQFPTTILCMVSMVVVGMKRLVQKQVLHTFFLSTVFTSSLISEMAVFISSGDLFSFFPFGINIGFLLFGVILNEKIATTYRERDYLRANLEAEVANKTEELSAKADELSKTLAELRSTQSELVQSAKLASLGTLAAGIAHEINNAINYVNGAIKPLESIVLKSCADSERGKIEKLFGVIRDGVDLTVKIVKSLRTHSGINQAKFKDVRISEVVESVLVILKSKWKNHIEISTSIETNITVFGSHVGLNQVFMNLISNAIDATPKGGFVKIVAEDNLDCTKVIVSDTGHGIPNQIVDRIFEPFFTTKEVGKGTGLGLHIVRKEIEAQGGQISVRSTPERGTEFILIFPKNRSNQLAAS